MRWKEYEKKMSRIGPLEIPKRSTVCCQGKEPFGSEMEYASLLLEEEGKERLVRKDYCLSCWEKQEPLGDHLELKTFWKGKVPEKKESEPLYSIELLLEWLKEAQQKESPEAGAEAFVLALFLARKKQLILRQELIHQNHEILLYEVPSTEEMIPVKKMTLALEEIARLQKLLNEKCGLEKKG